MVCVLMWLGKSSSALNSSSGTTRWESLKPCTFPALLGSSQNTCMAVLFSTLVKILGVVGTVRRQGRERGYRGLHKNKEAHKAK